MGAESPRACRHGAKPEPPPLPPDLFDQIEDWAQEKFDSGFEKQRQAITTEFEEVFGKKSKIKALEGAFETRLTETERAFEKTKEELGVIHQHLCERAIVIGAHTAFGFASQMKRKAFYDAFGGKRDVLKSIFDKETGMSMPDEDVQTFLDVLNPDPDAATIVRRGDLAAHESTIEKARSYVKNKELIAVLDLVSKD